MKIPTVTTTPKMTIHLDAHKFAHEVLEGDIIIGTSTSVTPKGEKKVDVVSINNEGLPIGDNAPDWREILSEQIGELVEPAEYKDDKVELDFEEICNVIENSIYAELKKIGVQL